MVMKNYKLKKGKLYNNVYDHDLLRGNCRYRSQCFGIISVQLSEEFVVIVRSTTD